MRWIALAALLIAPPAFAEMYKCVDQRGRVVYADKPQPGCKGGAVDIQPIPSISGAPLQAPAAPSNAQQDADFKRRQIERERQEMAERQAQDQRCARARQELAWLSNNPRIARINDAGERVYIDESDREARIAQLRQAVRGCP